MSRDSDGLRGRVLPMGMLERMCFDYGGDRCAVTDGASVGEMIGVAREQDAERAVLEQRVAELEADVRLGHKIVEWKDARLAELEYEHRVLVAIASWKGSPAGVKAMARAALAPKEGQS